jgi:hypothetical protein
MAKTKLASTTYAEARRPGVNALLQKAGDVFHYAAAMEATFEKHFLSLSGYQRFTTFAGDLAIAECYGDNAILDTFDRVCESWLSDYKFFTEFVLTLNWLSWFWAGYNDRELSILYGDLFYEAEDMFYDRYRVNDGDSADVVAKKEEATDYFFNTTD